MIGGKLEFVAGFAGVDEGVGDGVRGCSLEGSWSWSSASRASTRVLAMEFEDAVWREGSPHPEEGCLRF